MDHQKDLNMHFDQPVTDLIEQRFSCRTYQNKPIDPETRRCLTDFFEATRVGPMGNHARFKLVASEEGDASDLRGMGTYGFIKNPTGFIIGACRDEEMSLEDYGYLMEAIILQATDLGLGTCWLGGTFNRSRFAREIGLGDDEIIPAVTSLGYIAEDPRRVDQTIRNTAGSDRRMPWSELFFEGSFDQPLERQEAGEFALPLLMVRIGPSASNKQPWRIVKIGEAWHFYLRRTPGYPSPVFNLLLSLADLQRVDMGIAMCHFDLTAKHLGLEGDWGVNDPGIALLDEHTEYSISWIRN
jgi:nitroreductase